MVVTAREPVEDCPLRSGHALVQPHGNVVEPTIALKGGTAINLFYRDMPRLAVDMT